LADKLSANLGSVNADTPGDFHIWAESWASESIVLALGAYHGIQLGHCTLKNDGTIAKIQIVKRADYVQEQSPVVEAQLSKAALRLATLLNLVLDQPTPVPTPTPSPSPQPSPTSTQWEYQMISAAHATELLNQANTQGTQGWELSSVAVDTSRPDKYVGFSNVRSSSLLGTYGFREYPFDSIFAKGLTAWQPTVTQTTAADHRPVTREFRLR